MTNRRFIVMIVNQNWIISMQATARIKANMKVLLTVLIDCRGVIQHEFLLQSRTVNKEYYPQVMRNSREPIRQKYPDLWKKKNWFWLELCIELIFITDYWTYHYTLFKEKRCRIRWCKKRRLSNAKLVACQPLHCRWFKSMFALAGSIAAVIVVEKIKKLIFRHNIEC